MFIVYVIPQSPIAIFKAPLFAFASFCLDECPCAAFGNTDSPGWVHRHASTELSTSACMDLEAVLEAAVLSKLELMSLYSETQTPKAPKPKPPKNTQTINCDTGCGQVGNEAAEGRCAFGCLRSGADEIAAVGFYSGFKEIFSLTVKTQGVGLQFREFGVRARTCFHAS